jgi:NagD protein
MLRTALRQIAAHSEEAVMIGDRMDTDIARGIESGPETIRVPTGVSTRDSATRFAYRPTHIVDSVADILP